MRLPKRHKKLSNSYASRMSASQEDRVARELGGYITPNSGAGSTKGDVRLRDIARVECKSTEKDKFLLSFKIIEKIRKEALASGEVPLLQLDFIQPCLKTYCFYIIEEMYIPDKYEALELTINKSSVTLHLENLSQICKFCYNKKWYYIFETKLFRKGIVPNL